MRKISRITFHLMLSMVMLLTIVPNQLIQAASTDLVNIASKGSLAVPSFEAGRPASQMIDGNPDTLWVANDGTWPATVRLTLPKDNVKPIKKIVVKFEKNKPDWTVDVQLDRYINDVISPVLITKESDHKYNNALEYEFSEDQAMTDILVTLSNPKNAGETGKFYPAIAELEVYVERDGDDGDDPAFANLAPNASITSASNTPENSSDRLIDNDYSSLFIFHKGNISTIPGGEAWVQLDLKEDYDVNSLEIAFEKYANDPNAFKFTYSLYGQAEEDTDWNVLVEHAFATREPGDNVKTHKIAVENQTVKLCKVKIVIESIDSKGDPWPAIAEFKIFGIENTMEDADNIAWKKPVHTNTNQANGSKITDGIKSNNWTGTYYPGYADIDLEENYRLDEIEVYLPEAGYSQYDIYTSMDGRDFKKLASKTNQDPTPASGDIIDAKQQEARIVRVYVNYRSQGAGAIIHEVRIKGEKSQTAIQTTPEVDVEDFQDSEYNIDVTPAMAIDEVKGIITRQLGAAYVDWFTFEIAENPKNNGYDYYQISDDTNGKILIQGNDGVSLATGLNYYLKYKLHVNISQVGNQTKMPASVVAINDQTIFKETKLPVRYAYNYCTLSYSMAFWGEKEWRNELDWLALNGVNAVLDATAQEEVWRRFLSEAGYTPMEAKDFISGPAYYAWSYMANMSGYGGPVHDSWFVDRTDLARKNQLTMRKLGMQPILQGYSGMVPIDIETKDTATSGNVIPQGSWCSYTRPYMLKTNTQVYKDYAQRFYRIQKEVFGDVTNLFATDPFHEGGNPGGMNMSDVGRIIQEEMMKVRDDATWFIQAWGSNPTNDLLNGVSAHKENVLILDLYAEKLPRWENWAGGEFADTPWIFCMLNNFGGRLGLHGHIENFVNNIPKAINSADHMKGIGITPEASVNNPVLYDLFFETIWSDDGDNVPVIDLDTWYKDYATRRYGAESDAAYQALQILNETVYNPDLNMKGQGAPESIINARPDYTITAASTWGNAIIDYDKTKLEDAAHLLLEDYAILKDSEGYRYDLANVLEQVLSNSAQEYQKAMTRAYQSGNVEQFKTLSEKFLSLIDMVENVTGTQEKFLVGTWIEQAKALADNADEFTKELYEFNARSLISTWGSIAQANSGGLKDYSNRQWAGLTNDYYKPRWERWINERIKDMEGSKGQTITNNDWFQMEWEWVNKNNTYTTKSNGLDLLELGKDVLMNYAVESIPKDPAEDASKDMPMDHFVITTGSEQSTTGSEGPAKNLFDDNSSTIWHTNWYGTDRSTLWVEIDLGESTLIDGLRYLPRQDGGANGTITGYKVEVKNGDDEFVIVAEGSWNNDASWKLLTFESVQATNIRISATASSSNNASYVFASGAEMRITQPSGEVNKEALQALIIKVEGLTAGSYTPDSWKVLQDALAEAKAIVNDEQATQAEVDTAYTSLQDAIAQLKEETSFVKTLLLNAINKANAAEASGQLKYLAPSVKKMILDARDAAVKVYDDETATIAQVMEAWMNLADAMHYMNFVANKEALQTLVDTNKDLDMNDYKEGVEAFNKALANAKAVLADDKALQARIDEAYKQLYDAVQGLVEKDKVSKEYLEMIVTSIKEHVGDGSKYKQDENWNTFVEALSAAENVLADDKATQEDVEQALSALTGAYEDIRLEPTEDQLDELNSFVDKAGSINRSLYTNAQLKQIDTLVAEAKSMLKDFDSKKYGSLLKDMEDTGKLIDKVENKKPNKPANPSKPSIDGGNGNVANTTKPSAKPNTSDATNMMATWFVLLGAGVIVNITRRKCKKS